MCIATKIIKSYFRMMTKHEIRDIIIKNMRKIFEKGLDMFMLCGVKSLHIYIHNKFVLFSNDNKGTKMSLCLV